MHEGHARAVKCHRAAAVFDGRISVCLHASVQVHTFMQVYKGGERFQAKQLYISEQEKLQLDSEQEKHHSNEDASPPQGCGSWLRRHKNSSANSSMRL